MLYLYKMICLTKLLQNNSFTELAETLVSNMWILSLKPVVAQGHTVNATGCGFDPHSKKWNIYLNLYFLYII